ANLDVQLAVRAEEDLAGVVVAAQGLAGVDRMCVVLLKRPQLDQVPVERQRILLRIEDKTVHAVAERLSRAWRERRIGVADLSQIAGNRAGAAFSPIEINEMVAREARVQGDAEQAALGRIIDRQIRERGSGRGDELQRRRQGAV